MKKTFLISLVLSSTLLSNNTTEIEFNLIQSIMPKTKINKIQKTPIDGLYEVYLKNNDFLYIYPYKELIIFGEIYTKNGKSLTQYNRQQYIKSINTEKKRNLNKLKTRNNENIEYFKKLIKNGLNNDIAKAKKQKFQFIVYHSPVCGYCNLLTTFFNSKNISTYKYYIPHPKSYQELKNIYKVKNPKEKIEQQMKLIEKFSLEGTPNIIVLDNKNNYVDLVEGFDKEKLLNYINKD